MTCIYSIVPRVRTPSINPGNSIEIEIFLTGYGDDAKDNKFQISYSSPKLLEIDDKGKVGFVECCIKVALNNKGKIVGVLTGNAKWKDPQTSKTEKAIHLHPLDKIGTTITLNQGYFMKNKEAIRLSGKKVDEKDARILSEMTHDGHPPILLKFNTLSNAVSGDHNIVLTLFYTDGSEVKMDQKVITIHVNNWIEKHQKTLQWIAIILGLSALSAGIIQAIYTVLQYFK